jgi:hypothetical protein
MASGISGSAQLRNVYGVSIARAAGNLAQTGNLTLFTVTGGRILLTTIVGVVTTAIQAQANAVKLQSLSTTGAIATDMCATVDVNAAAAGNLFGITGTAATAAVLGSSVPQMNELIVAAGVIRMNAAASNTGQMSWLLTYIPLDAGAYVTAA